MPRSRLRPQRPKSRKGPNTPQKTRAEHRALKRIVRDLPNHPDVIGVTTGYRLKGGSRSDEHCVTVFVRKKKPKTKVSRKRLIPKFFYGRNADGSIDRKVKLYTDVVQMKTAKALNGVVSGGNRIFVQGLTGTMTLAFNDFAGGRRLLLTNRHVLAPKLNAGGSHDISCRIGGTLKQIGDLADYFLLSSEGGRNFYDAALGELNSDGEKQVQYTSIQESSSNAASIKSLRSIGNNENGAFWLTGGNSGTQNGRLWDRLKSGGSWNIDYDNFGVLTVERLYGLMAFSRRGDSGAPIYERAEGGVTLIGLAVAVANDDDTGRTITLFHSITDVEAAFSRLLGRKDFKFLQRS